MIYRLEWDGVSHRHVIRSDKLDTIKLVREGLEALGIKSFELYEWDTSNCKWVELT